MDNDGEVPTNEPAPNVAPFGENISGVHRDPVVLADLPGANNGLVGEPVMMSTPHSDRDESIIYLSQNQLPTPIRPSSRNLRNIEFALGQLAGNFSHTSGTPHIPQSLPNVDIRTTPTPRRKKRRVHLLYDETPSPPATEIVNNDEDSGSTCPICLDSWELSGEHRLVSLKCGHLFGDSCIRRWFTGSAANLRCCPSCKTKASLRDLRPIYAKRICVVDSSEEHRLLQRVEEEMQKVSSLKQELALLKLDLEVQRKFNAQLEQQLSQTKMTAINLNMAYNAGQSTSSKAPNRVYKLSRESTISICSEPGCRVLTHGQKLNRLIVSQKSIQSLFPGFGVRFVDLPTFRATSFLHMAAKQVRDLALDNDDQLLAAASMDRTCKLFTINNRGVFASFTPTDKPIWSVAFDKSRAKVLYFGTQNGLAYRYDIRHPNQFVEEYRTAGDLSPVIKICSVPPNEPEFPFGGFLVCKLQSLWFYEYSATQTVSATQLTLTGPFVSMTYEDSTRHILIATRPTSAQPTSQYIYAELRKIGQTTLVQVLTMMEGSKVQAVMSRSAQLRVENSTMVTAYLQDTKILQTWEIRAAARQNQRMQSLSIDECVLDTCPIYLDQGVYMGALTETKCRIFRINGEDA